MACQPTVTPQIELPTEAVLPSITPLPPTPPPITPEATFTPSATITPTIPVTPSATLTPTLTLPPSATFTPSVTPTLVPSQFIFGQSAGGLNLLGRRIGTGHTFIFIIGGIHAGFESNTIDLVYEMIAHFERNPADIRPEISLIFVPVMNPDGYRRGRIVEGRFNSNGVDLNRNWGCGWSAQAEWRLGEVDPGTGPFSEPETTSSAALAHELQPRAVIFYHGAVNGVFAGECDSRSDSFGLAAAYGEASGYPYGERFSEYDLTGTAPNYFDSIGIPSVDVELATAEGTERTRNIRGIIAVQQWVVARLQGGR